MGSHLFVNVVVVIVYVIILLLLNVVVSFIIAFCCQLLVPLQGGHRVLDRMEQEILHRQFVDDGLPLRFADVAHLSVHEERLGYVFGGHEVRLQAYGAQQMLDLKICRQ